MKDWPLFKLFLAGAGGFTAIFFLAALTCWKGTPLLMAPFGASCVLLFSVPNSPLSQPINVIGGHLVSSFIGVTFALFLYPSPWVLAISVGIAISAMALLNVTHPPAGADPIVILLGYKGFSFLLFPVLFGSVFLVLVACLYHRFFGTAQYPISLKNPN